jgi:hypothetical protein
MKASILIKVFLILPLLVFIDYVLMILIGCASCLFGAEKNFYCGSYCIAGKIILIITALFFIFLIYPDIKSIFNLKKDATATKE